MNVDQLALFDLALFNLEAHFNDEPDYECVGFLLADGSTVRLKNQARSRKRFFVNPSQFIEISPQLTSPITALYHSHLDTPPAPSGEDRRMMRYLITVWPDVYHIILSPSGHMGYHVVNDGVIEKKDLPWLSKPDP